MRASRGIAGLAVALGVGAGSGASGAVTVYRSTGFVDSSYAATSVTCYNPGPGSSDVGVRFYSGGATLACEATVTAVASGATVTISSRPTGLLYEHAVCETAPGLSGGWLAVVVNDTAAQRIRCAVRLLAPTGAQPAFALLLPVYSRSWILMADYVFESDFETGGTVDWSVKVP